MPASLPIDFAGERLVLLGDRAIHWPAHNTLIVADVHLGKDASFRAAGLTVPAGNSTKDLSRIDALVKLTQSSKLIILGDLIHSRQSHQAELAAAFKKWRAVHPDLELLLVRGNHDNQSGPTPADWNISACAELAVEGPWHLAHHPQPSDLPVLCGHVHPTIAIRDFDGSSARMPCFVVDEHQIILPAFGSFTGGFRVDPAPGRKIFVTTGRTVIALPSPDRESASALR